MEKSYYLTSFRENIRISVSRRSSERERGAKDKVLSGVEGEVSCFVIDSVHDSVSNQKQNIELPTY